MRRRPPLSRPAASSHPASPNRQEPSLRLLPEELASLLHRYEPSSIDLGRHPNLIIRTVLAEGAWEQVLWLFREYGWGKVKEVVLADHHGLRTLPEPTRRLWLAVFSEPGQPPVADEQDDPVERWRCRRHPKPAAP